MQPKSKEQVRFSFSLVCLVFFFQWNLCLSIYYTFTGRAGAAANLNPLSSQRKSWREVTKGNSITGSLMKTSSRTAKQPINCCLRRGKQAKQPV